MCSPLQIPLNHTFVCNPPKRNRRGENPRAIPQAKCVGSVPVYPPERSHSDVSMPKIHALCAGMNDGCALVGRHGRAHRHRPYQSPSNQAVCPYPIGVILSIAQGWQVQRSLPWVTMQARRLPPWGLYFFSLQHNDCNYPTHSGAEMHRALPPPLLKIKKCVYVMIWVSPWMTAFALKQIILLVSP